MTAVLTLFLGSFLFVSLLSCFVRVVIQYFSTHGYRSQISGYPDLPSPPLPNVPSTKPAVAPSTGAGGAAGGVPAAGAGASARGGDCGAPVGRPRRGTERRERIGRRGVGGGHGAVRGGFTGTVGRTGGGEGAPFLMEGELGTRPHRGTKCGRIESVPVCHSGRGRWGRGMGSRNPPTLPPTFGGSWSPSLTSLHPGRVGAAGKRFPRGTHRSRSFRAEICIFKFCGLFCTRHFFGPGPNGVPPHYAAHRFGQRFQLSVSPDSIPMCGPDLGSAEGDLRLWQDRLQDTQAMLAEVRLPGVHAERERQRRDAKSHFLSEGKSSARPQGDVWEYVCSSEEFCVCELGVE